MAKQIKVYVDDDAYDAMTIECKKRGQTQGKLITEALRQMLLNESVEQEETIMLDGLRQALAKLDCLLSKLGVSEAEVEARLYPNDKPMTPEKHYGLKPEDTRMSTPPVAAMTPQPERGVLRRLLFHRSK